MEIADDVTIRRVGFRAGTDRDLTALHSVEVPIAAERGSHRMPSVLDSYMAFARSLPSTFNDHAWLAEDGYRSAIACGFCWSNLAGDPSVMECDIAVRRDRRREGIGSRLFRKILEVANEENRTLLVWESFDAVPAGGVFSVSLGAQPGRVNRTSELNLADVDWCLIDEWAKARRTREAGYTLEIVEGVFPEDLRIDAVTLHHIMQTAPRDDLQIGDVLISSDDVGELDQALLDSGRLRWAALIRDSEKACVGGSEVTFEPGEPELVLQQSTAIDPAHRGIGLAKWAKAVILERVRNERPETKKIRTGNAYSNAPMLAINNALGFRVVGTTTEWQAKVGGVN